MAKEKQFVQEITDMTVDFPQWYTDVVLKTELVDYGPKGRRRPSQKWNSLQFATLAPLDGGAGVREWTAGGLRRSI